MTHSKLFWFTAWMIAFAGVFGGGQFLLFESAISADLGIDNLYWLESAMMDLFTLSMIAAVVGGVIMFVMFLSSVSMFFIGKANANGIHDKEMICCDEPTHLPVKMEEKVVTEKKVVAKAAPRKKVVAKKK